MIKDSILKTAFFLAAFFSLLFSQQGRVSATAIFSIGTGDFNSPGTWFGGSIPTASDTAVIVTGDTVKLTAPATLAGLRIMPSAKFDNNNFQLSLDNSGGILYYIVYGEHNISGNLEYNGAGGATLKMLGPSFSPGGLISGFGEFRMKLCSGDSITGFFNIPEASIAVGYVAGCGGAILTNAGIITMTNGDISVDNNYAFKNYGSISMEIGSIVLMMGTGTSAAALRNYGNLLLNNGSLIYTTNLTVQNEVTGVITIQKGNIDMAEGSSGSGQFRNKGIVTLAAGYITEPISGSKVQLFWNDDGSTLNIGGIGEPIFPGSPAGSSGFGSAVLLVYGANTINYMGTGKQKIRRPFVVKATGAATNPVLHNYWHLGCSGDSAKSIDGFDLEVKGNLTLRDSAILDVSQDGGTTNFNITLSGNWYDSSQATQAFLPRDKKVTFNGTSPQSIITTNIAGEETFYDLVINNKSTGLSLLKGNINISDTLTLTDGLITTGLDTVWVSNMDTASIKSYSDSTYVNGFLKRSIDLNTSSSYDFPVGNANAYELANVNFNGSNTIDALTVDFGNSTGISGLPLNDANEAQYESLLNCGGTATGMGNPGEGVWNIRPGTGSAIYDLSLHGRYFDNPGTMYHSIVKRANNTDPWAFAGTYLGGSQNSDTIIAKRTCLTDFYQFAIASSNTATPLIATPISFHSDDTMICGSKCIDFTAKSILSATKWRWKLGGGVFATASDSMLQNPSNICFNTTGNYDVRLIASTACHADTLKITQYIKVNPIPSITITGDNSICSGKRTILSDSTSALTLTYLWSTGSTGRSINVLPLISTTYSVLVSTGFCQNTDSVVVDVTPSPTASLTASTTAICSGESVSLTASGTAEEYLWNTGESGTAITASPLLPIRYSLQLSNGSCSDTDSIFINVTTQPTATITGETSICSGRLNVLSATSSITGINYLWNTGATSGNINASSSTSSTYSVVLSNGNCKDTADFFVSVTTTPSIILTANKTIICSGDSVVLNASAGNETGIYLWSNGQNTSTITVSPLLPAQFSLKLSNENCYGSDSILITVVPMPTVSISGPSTVCSGSSSSFTATGGEAYLWNTGETSTSITKTPFSNARFSVSVSNGNGLCTDTASKGVNLIGPIPTDAGSDITMPIGLDTVLSANNGTTWNWAPLGRLNCYTCQSTIANPLQTTIYTLTVTDINGCIVSDSITIYIIPCAELYIPKAFSPNNDAQNDVLYIRGTDCIEKIFSFTIFNRWGEKVFETTDIKAGWDGSQSKENMSNEVFIYYLDALSINGDAISKTGNVTLMK